MDSLEQIQNIVSPVSDYAICLFGKLPTENKKPTVVADGMSAKAQII